MIGYDIDGTLTGQESLGGCVVISGRTFAEYDETCKRLAQRCPVYIRGVGAYGDQNAAGLFKAQICRMLNVTDYYEDDPVQAQLIRDYSNTNVILVQR